MTVNVRTITGTAMLLAIALMVQSLRLIFPIPPQVSMFVIGTIVSATYVLATWRYSWKAGLVIAWITPIVAYAQGMLPIAPLVIVTGLGTTVYVLLVHWLRDKAKWLMIGVAAISRMVVLYCGALALLYLWNITGPKAMTLLLVFSWPQLITSSLGIMIALVIMRRMSGQN